MQTFAGFMSLPVEIRQLIYAEYFASTTLTYPNLTTPSLLLSCHQLREEALPFFRPKVRLGFRTTEDLMVFLAGISDGELIRLRHIAMVGHHEVPLGKFWSWRTLTLDMGWDWSGRILTLDMVLTLFPGLQLDTLLVESPHLHGYAWGYGNYAFDPVKWLIQSNGFKQLIYTVKSRCFRKPVNSTTMSTWQPGDPFIVTTTTEPPVPRPSIWDAMIKEKDGADSGARVEVFRLLHDARCCRPLQEDGEITYVATTLFGGDDLSSWVDGEIEIRITRGQHTNYVQEGAHLHGEDEMLSILVECIRKSRKENSRFA
ncbi:MAG: hypothetical protein L6R38_005672 [Xanthoria sp. 2 TBL-2021]|nr:MAG: hypothetical protein L6R38_005672 [Xanthoria sp. 2 TBL-2021]